MYIRSLRIKNHKSFLDSGEINLAPGFNVVIGKNDSGKSALIESINHATALRPHRSHLTAPYLGATPPETSEVEIVFSLSGQDIRRSLGHQKSIHLVTPYSTGSLKIHEYFRRILVDGSILLASWDGKGNLGRAQFDGLPTTGDTQVVQLTWSAVPDDAQAVGINTSPEANKWAFPRKLADICKSRIYCFKAERLGVSECHIQGGKELHPNASNLPDVLLTLTSSDAMRREQFLSLVRQVFPHITLVTSQPAPNSQSARIYVHTVPVEEGRSDLAVPLSESGTGIGQVLAILYVVVTSNEPGTIIIDEPHSFLHPGAARKLLDILRFQFPQHQYIISSHAPIPLGNSERDALLIVRKDGHESVVEQVDHTTENALRTSLAEVGMRHSDVFGADAILWVEGKTEESCFPRLIRGLTQSQLLGVQILGVISTDELANKQAERMFDIYGRLSGGSSLLPPALAFVLDMEERTAAQREEIEKRSGGKVVWLPRRMYENYLLVPSAIAELINREDSQRVQPVTEAEITDWLNLNGQKTGYQKATNDHAYGSEDWNVHVNGAKVLNDLFNHFTEARVAYSKVRHGEALTDMLLNSPSPALRELANMLARIVQQA